LDRFGVSIAKPHAAHGRRTVVDVLGELAAGSEGHPVEVGDAAANHLFEEGSSRAEHRESSPSVREEPALLVMCEVGQRVDHQPAGR
jgi:hypothetical protein